MGKQDIVALKKSNKSNNDKKVLSEREKLKEWITTKVGLPEYFDIFIENGVEDLETAKLMTMEDLQIMNIKKIGHKKKIMQRVGMLNQNVAAPNNNKMAYGGGGYEGH